MKNLFFILLFCLVGILQSNAQEYQSAIGLRLGYPTSITYKHFINDRGAVEAFLGARVYSTYRWTNIGLAYQHHTVIPDVSGLKWYYGGGASLFFWNYDKGFDGDGNLSIGVLGVLGLDYKFADHPINLSVDWMPLIFLNGYGSGFGGGYGALSARYTIK
jgi:outer membrane protein W